MNRPAIAAGLVALLAGAASAQTTTAPQAPATATPPAATTPGGMDAGQAIVVLPPMAAGAARTHFLADDLQEEEVYGADDEEVGEVEDVVLNADGSIAAVVLEVGGFLGVGEKDVLVNWSALTVAADGDDDDDLRISSAMLTREVLEGAADVDLDAMGLGDD